MDSTSAAADLARNFTQLAQALNSIDDHLACYDRQWRYTYINDQGAEMLGKLKEELLGHCIWDVFPDLVGGSFYQSVHSAVEQQRIIRSVDYYAPWQRWFENHIHPHADGVVVYASDFTWRRQAEQEIHDKESLIQSIGDHLPGAIFRLLADEQGGRRFLYISGGIERILGIRPDEVLADPMALYGLIDPRDLPRVLADEDEAQRTGAPFDCVFRSRTRAGERRWLHCRSAKAAHPDGTSLWHGLVLDVTDRYRHEQILERYRLLSQHARDIVLFIDLGGRIVEANDAAVQIYGYPREELIGLPVTALRHPDTQTTVQEQILEADEIGIRFETVHQRKDGTPIPVEVSSRGADIGDQRLLMSIIRDITERRAAEDALRESDRRKDEFLAMLAHELRNPLAPIRNAVEILRAHPAGERENGWAQDVIERQVQQLTRLVDDLLDVSRITRGKIELRKEPLRLADVVQQALEISRPMIAAAQHRLAVEVPSEPIWIEADRTRLAQVIANLLNNAAKYTYPGGQIDLRVEPDGAQAVVRVRDTGIGIEPRMLTQIFDLFTQADTSLERSQGGLGIGLTIAHRLVEMHGGSLRVHSDGPSRGSEFSVYLPVAEPPPVIEAPHASALAPAACPLRILVADDNRDAAAALARLLSMFGHEVVTAHDGALALTAARQHRPHLALLDIGMPGMNGYEVARRMRQELSETPPLLAALTGWGAPADRLRSQDAGFEVHLVKPVDLVTLQQVLSRVQASLLT